MSDISQGSHVKLILKPGDVFRISTAGSATVASAYGAPAGTTTVTANTQDFGPYQADAKLILTATSGAASYRLLGADTSGYTDAQALAAAKAGIAASVLAAQSVNTLSAQVNAAIAAMPAPKNNLLAVVGDSRVACVTTLAYAAAEVLWGYGWGSWMQVRSRFRFELTGAYGVGNDRIQDVYQRMIGPALVNTTAGLKDNFMTTAPGNTAATVVVLCGVNNQLDAASVTGPYYTQLIQLFLDAGINVVLVTEIPQNNVFSAGPANLARHQYLANFVPTGVNAKRLVKVNVYNSLLTPGTLYNTAIGTTYADEQHPRPPGYRIFGETVGAVLDQMGTAFGFPPRSTAITLASQGLFGDGMLVGATAITATNGETAGAGGANMDGAGGVGISGTVPTGWSVNRSSALKSILNAAQGTASNQLSAVCSTVLDSDGFEMQRFRISGQIGATATPTALYQISLDKNTYLLQTTWTANYASKLADGDFMYLGGRVRMAANPKGLAATSINCALSTAANTFPSMYRGVHDWTGGSNIGYADWAAMAALEWEMITPRLLVPAGFSNDGTQKNFTRQFCLQLLNNTPIDITVDVGRLDFQRNL